jgi:type IV pilus assembly protein PilM
MQILAIHLDPPFYRIALVKKGHKGIEISRLESNLLPENPNVKPLYIENFSGKVASCLSAKDFLIRGMELKIAGSRHVEEAIAFQSETLSHFDPKEIILVPLVQKKDKGRAEAILFTAARESLKKHFAELKKLDIDPDTVSTIPSALCHFIRWKFPNLLDAFIIDLGSSEVTCVLMEDGKLKKAHALSGGVEKLLDALFEDRKKILLKKEIEGAAKQIDLLLLKKSLNPHLSGDLLELRQEIAKTYFSFSREAGREVIFTGRSGAFIHLREFLMEEAKSEWILSVEEQKYAIPIGLGIEQTSEQPLQLRREEFFPQKNWARMGVYATTLLTASILISAALFGIGMRSTHVRKTNLLRSIHVEQGGSIDKWISSIEKNDKEYPYILQAPRVAEVFAWLSSHPLLEELKIEGDPIDVREIRYELVSLPKISSPKEPYSAKVELIFNFNHPTNARKFHEALRKGDARVNPNLEVTWDPLQEGYRTSFFLKNRSSHEL